MVNIVVKKCPECGARLQLDINSDHAKCDYCGAVSRIESKKPKGPPPPNVNRSEPVIYLSAGTSAYRWVWIFSALFTVGIIGFSVYMSSSAMRNVTGGITQLVRSTGPGSGGAAGQSALEHMQWVGHRQPMLADISGDGVQDVIGWIRFLASGGTTYDHLGAFNAVTGERIWKTGPLSDTSQSYNAKAALSGDKIVVADPSGVVKAFSLMNGGQVWQTVVGERVEKFCGGPAGQVVVHLKDKRSLGINVATGQISPMGQVDRKTSCPLIQNDSTESGPLFTVGGGPWDDNGIVNPKLSGMRSEKVIVDNATRKTLAIGTREPGTRTPMAALYQLANANKKKATALWMTSVSSQNPLTVKEGAPDRGAISQGRLIIPYELQGSKAGAKLSCLDEATGRILWDVPIPRSETGSIGGLTTSVHHVFVAHWTYLDIFQLVDGAHKITIGVW